MNFVTTNIRLGAEIYQRLRLKAAQERKSLAQLIRDAVELAYGEPRRRGPARTHRKQDSFFKIVGIGKSRIHDGAEHHDEIYGADW